MQVGKASVNLAKGIAAIAAIALVVTVCVPNAVPSFRSALKLSSISAFKQVAGRYISSTAGAEETEEEKVMGRLVVIDTVQRDADPAHFQLDAAIRAEGPENVGTVALVTWSIDPDGGPGSTPVGLGAVVLVDPHRKLILGRETIVGDDAEPPRAAVAKYLNALPRVPAAR